MLKTKPDQQKWKISLQMFSHLITSMTIYRKHFVGQKPKSLVKQNCNWCFCHL